MWNYAAGIARMRFRDYFWATLLGVIPSHIVFTYCADSLINGTMTQGDALRRLAIVCALLLALIAIPLFIKKRLGARSSHPKCDAGVIPGALRAYFATLALLLALIEDLFTFHCCSRTVNRFRK